MPTYLSPGVYVEEVEAGARPIEGVGTSVAAFVGLAGDGPINEPVLITNWSQYTQTFGEFMDGSYLAHTVYGYFLNGGGTCYVVRIGGDQPPTSARAELPTAKDKGVSGYRVTALEAGTPGNQIRIEVGDSSDEAEDTFKLTVRAPGKPDEVYDNTSFKHGKTSVVTTVKQESKLITIEEIGPANLERAPARGSQTLGGSEVAKPVTLTPDDYVGDAADRTGFSGLEAVDAVTMLSVPDLMAMYQAGDIDLEGVQAVQTAMLAHCELMGDRVAILDAPPGLNAQQVDEWRTDKVGYDSKYGTLYWPWIKVFDPVAGQARFVPPSGHVAGVWARSDEERGVHKAPANEILRGALALELNITKGEHDQLNPDGINCIRAFPGRGIRIWGARTLSSDPAWRYLNVRRLFNYIEESVLEGTQWVVFEPNDLDLWQRVKRTINAFLMRTWREGALFGATPQEAFFVKCDAETNPPDVVDAGQLIVEIGVAPVKPAEFVIFRIAQYSGGEELSE
jgi:phage tail sheath protein FI